MTNTDEMEDNKVHEGRNIKRFREMNGLKQDALASLLGEGWTQRRVSLLEGKDVIEPEILEEVAKALKITPEVIKNFNPEDALNIMASNHDGRDYSSAVHSINYKCTFNPIDKLVEVFDENKRLYEQLLRAEKELLQVEREKVAMLEKQLAEKK